MIFIFDSRCYKKSLVAIRPGSKRPGFELPLRVEVPGVKKNRRRFSGIEKIDSGFETLAVHRLFEFDQCPNPEFFDTIYRSIHSIGNLSERFPLQISQNHDLLVIVRKGLNCLS